MGDKNTVYKLTYTLKGSDGKVRNEEVTFKDEEEFLDVIYPHLKELKVKDNGDFGEDKNICVVFHGERDMYKTLNDKEEDTSWGIRKEEDIAEGIRKLEVGKNQRLAIMEVETKSGVKYEKYRYGVIEKVDSNYKNITHTGNGNKDKKVVSLLRSKSDADNKGRMSTRKKLQLRRTMTWEKKVTDVFERYLDTKGKLSTDYKKEILEDENDASNIFADISETIQYLEGSMNDTDLTYHIVGKHYIEPTINVEDIETTPYTFKTQHRSELLYNLSKQMGKMLTNNTVDELEVMVECNRKRINIDNYKSVILRIEPYKEEIRQEISLIDLMANNQSKEELETGEEELEEEESLYTQEEVLMLIKDSFGRGYEDGLKDRQTK